MFAEVGAEKWCYATQGLVVWPVILFSIDMMTEALLEPRRRKSRS